jgi:hypothetical protein
MKPKSVNGRLDEVELVAQPTDMEALFMKRHLLRLAALAGLAVAGFGFAQSDTHDVTVRIPSVLQVRITNGTSTAASAAPAVTFDYQTNAADVTTYLNTVNAGGGDLPPTLVTDFGNVLVFSNRVGTWNLGVSALNLTYSNNLGLTPAPTGVGVALADLKVTPAGTQDASVATRSPSYTLSNTSAVVATGTRTTGWASVGIRGQDYALTVNGNEDPGQYVTTVTYTITMP